MNINLYERIKNKIYRVLAIPQISDNKRLLANYLPKNPVVLEAGAHLGYDTIEMSALWKKGLIHAFEPVPAVYNILKKNTTGLKNVKTYPYALNDSSGFTEIFISSGHSDSSSSLLPPKDHLELHPAVLFNQKETIEAINLDEWAINNHITKIDFMWLDMQGVELKVLKSAPKIFSTVKLIYTEVHLMENYKGVPLYKEMKEWLLNQGFRVLKEEILWKDGGNVIFVRD